MTRRPRLVLALAFACLLNACAGGAARAPGFDASGSPTPPFSSLVASRTAVVVDINTLRVGRDESREGIEVEIASEIDFADRLPWSLPTSVQVSQIRDVASGVILTSDGLILTSAHVVADIDEATIRLNDGRRFQARVVGADPRTDVALVKIEATGLPVAVIGDSSRLAAGDWVAAIGAPFGFHGSVTTGVVSAVDRLIGGAGEIPFIQSDVVINPGSSGSPLFNSRGEVVAINSLIYSGSGGYMGLSFSVPINLAMKIAWQLRATGKVRRARLGAELQEMTPALARSFGVPESKGALVVRVDPEGPSQVAGLVRGDIITAFDGVAVARFTEMVQRVADLPPGTRRRLDLWRAGTRQTLWVTLSEQAAPRRTPGTQVAATWGDGLGLRLGELSPAQRLQLQLGSDAGLMVRESAGLARSEGIRAGDLIIAINNTRLERVEDFRLALLHLPPGRTVALLVVRDRRWAYVPVALPD